LDFPVPIWQNKEDEFYTALEEESMNPKHLHRDIQNFCKTHADETVARKYARYFREGYDAYGLSTPLLQGKVDTVLAYRGIDIDLILKTGDLLVATGKYEEVYFAILLLKAFSREFSAGLLPRIERWFEIGIRNWAHTDVLCRDILSFLLIRDIIDLADLENWRTADNKYQRRALPVAMLPLLNLRPDFWPLFDFLNPLMPDRERVVQQGLGWFLREAWKHKADSTEAFLLKWRNDAPRLIFQYATEKMTREHKQRFRRDKRKPDGSKARKSSKKPESPAKD
jgi:3-methyladenine DNA glycosylase AlkD